MRISDAVKNALARRGLLLSRYGDQHRAEWMREVSRVASERVLLLSHGEACQILSALRATEHLGGDIAELGVAYGASAKLIATHAAGRPVHLFDTFAGLPTPGAGDSEKFQSGDFVSSIESVKAYLDGLNCNFHQGLFPATAATVQDRAFSFVHLDVDLYESTRAGLEFFYPRMKRGGILMSHDYLSATGVNRAFDEFFEGKAERAVELISGYQCMVVKL
jgi:O-methyltransferase